MLLIIRRVVLFIRRPCWEWHQRAATAMAKQAVLGAGRSDEGRRHRTDEGTRTDAQRVFRRQPKSERQGPSGLSAKAESRRYMPRRYAEERQWIGNHGSKSEACGQEVRVCSEGGCVS